MTEPPPRHPAHRHPDSLTFSDRFRGAMLGGAVGDALGAGVRKMTSDTVHQWFGPRGATNYLPVFGRRGAATELTQLTVFTLESLLRAKAVEARAAYDRVPLDFVRINHLRWLHTQGVPWEYAMQHYLATYPEPSGWLQRRPELFSTRNPAGLALYGMGELAVAPPDRTGIAQPPLGDGKLIEAAVWAAPTMAWGKADDGAFLAGSAVAGLLTTDTDVRGAGGLHADVLAQLARGVSLWDAVSTAETYRLPRVAGAVEVNRTLHTAMFAAQRGVRPNSTSLDIEFDVKDKPGELGIALTSVATSSNFAEAVLTAINQTADSSVTGALAGQLAGAIHGPAAIPQQWLAELELGEILDTLCTDAVEAFAPPAELPRWAQRYVMNTGDVYSPPLRLESAPARSVVDTQPIGVTERQDSAPPTQVLPVIDVLEDEQPQDEDTVADPAFSSDTDGHVDQPTEPDEPIRGSGSGTSAISELAPYPRPAEFRAHTRQASPETEQPASAPEDPFGASVPAAFESEFRPETGFNIEPVEAEHIEHEDESTCDVAVTRDQQVTSDGEVDRWAPVSEDEPIEFTRPEESETEVADSDDESPFGNLDHGSEPVDQSPESPVWLDPPEGTDPPEPAHLTNIGDDARPDETKDDIAPAASYDAAVDDTEWADLRGEAEPAEEFEPAAEPTVEAVEASVTGPAEGPADESLDDVADEAASVGSPPQLHGGGHAVEEDVDDLAPSLTERVLGCFLGGAVGNALGSDLEFSSAEDISDRFGPDGPTGLREAYGVHGAVTAGTQMTLFTAEGLIRASIARRTLDNENPLDEVQLAYQRWLHTQGVEWEAAAGPVLHEHPRPDGWLIGVRGLYATRSPDETVFHALDRFGRGAPQGLPGEPVNDSNGCGGVMRAAPAALWSSDPAEVFEVAAHTAALTHGHPSGYLAAGAFAVIVQQAVLGRSLDDGVWLALQVLETWEGHEETSNALAMAVDVAANGAPEPDRISEALGGGWTGDQALAIGVCATLAAGDDVGLALRTAVHHSGDSDSTGAICGNIIGALVGIGGLPVAWLADLELREVVEQVAMDCVVEFDRDPSAESTGSAGEDGQLPIDEDLYHRYPVTVSPAPSARSAGAGDGTDHPTRLIPAVSDADDRDTTIENERIAETVVADSGEANAENEWTAVPAEPERASRAGSVAGTLEDMDDAQAGGADGFAADSMRPKPAPRRINRSLPRWGEAPESAADGYGYGSADAGTGDEPTDSVEFDRLDDGYEESPSTPTGISGGNPT